MSKDHRPLCKSCGERHWSGECKGRAGDTGKVDIPFQEDLETKGIVKRASNLPGATKPVTTTEENAPRIAALTAEVSELKARVRDLTNEVNELRPDAEITRKARTKAAERMKAKRTSPA